MNHQLRRVVRGVVLIAHGPVIANGIGEHRARPIKGASCDRAANSRECLELRVLLDIPEDEGAVRTGSSDAALTLRVIGDSVASPHLDDFFGIGRVTVTTPSEVNLPTNC